jgi:hypothetical protein
LQEAGITVGNPGFQAGGRETDQYPGFWAIFGLRLISSWAIGKSL